MKDNKNVTTGNGYLKKSYCINVWVPLSVSNTRYELFVSILCTGTTWASKANSGRTGKLGLLGDRLVMGLLLLVPCLAFKVRYSPPLYSKFLGFIWRHSFEWGTINSKSRQSREWINCLLYVLALCTVANMQNFIPIAHSCTAELSIH